MYRRTSWRATLSSLPSITAVAPQRTGRRFASSFAARTSARATGVLIRWGLAGAAVYYYNTSNVFADEPRYATQNGLQGNHEPDTYSSIDAITEERHAQAKKSSNATVATLPGDQAAPSPLDAPEGLEQEAEQQGAFNEETGEINWDCPCLGGMAHGPCGEQFKAAFSCFVFSKEEPKGIDCIENFKTMQDCFREHPDIYGAQLDEDDEDGAAIDVEAPEPGVQHAVDTAREKINDTVERTADAISADVSQATSAVQQVTETRPSPTVNVAATAAQETSQRKLPAGGEDSEGKLVPKAWHDSTGDNEKSISKTQK